MVLLDLLVFLFCLVICKEEWAPQGQGFSVLPCSSAAIVLLESVSFCLFMRQSMAGVEEKC